MANQMYNNAKGFLIDGSIDLDGDTMMIALLGTGYSVDIDAHSAWSDVSASEISATGYTAGGSALASLAVGVDTGNDRAYFDAADPAWTSIGTATAGSAVIYKDSGAATTSWLVCHIDTATGATFPVDLTGGDYTITFAATSDGGILWLS